MKDLSELRVEIDEIDSKIAELFEMRMDIAKNVVLYKIANNMEIFQPEREKEVLLKNCKRIQEDNIKPYANDFFQNLMDLSKEYQKTFLKD